ncbi:MAG: imidazole glycerol phosphate synthase subunit HisH [Victivallaceae bacterium]|nr:imidazole glycerol phosphate synthase subunit HisH [Victivallaceae bacterium]
MTIALIDYQVGNLFSVTGAVEHCGGRVELVSEPTRLADYPAAILPGVGNFGDGMASLRRNGFVSELLKFAASGRPLLGICMGMQMLLDSSEEAPGEPGLGLIGGKVRLFPSAKGFKVPQIGWNQVKIPTASPLFDGVPDESFFYFVHSYYADPADSADVIGTTDYIVPYASAVGRGNIFGVQFHPEKSQNCGLRIVRNFIGIVDAQK